MSKKWLATVAVLAAFVLGVSVHKAGTSPRTPQPPLVVASFNMRGITQAIPTTTLFTPAVTGIYRASVYMTMTTPAGTGDFWLLNLNWTDDAGPESNVLAELIDNSIPPNAYEIALNGVGQPAPFVFEAVAGQPVTFSLSAASPPGTCGLSITIERLP